MSVYICRIKCFTKCMVVEPYTGPNRIIFLCLTPDYFTLSNMSDDFTRQGGGGGEYLRGPVYVCMFS